VWRDGAQLKTVTIFEIFFKTVTKNSDVFFCTALVTDFEKCVTKLSDGSETVANSDGFVEPSLNRH